MTILLTGGSGTTSQALAKVLHDSGHKLLLTSRSGSVKDPFQGVVFDWLDPNTFENPFKADPSIDRVYLVPPPTSDHLGVMKPFIELAKSRGVKRFVFLSATCVKKGDPPHGKVHEYLADEAEVDYAIIRPSWFFQNFVAANSRMNFIRDEDRIITAAGDGHAQWVNVDDIAEAISKALTEETPRNGDYVVVGPDTFTYDDIASLFSEVLGRKIVHEKYTMEGVVSEWTKSGLPVEHATIMGIVDTLYANNLEEKYTGDMEKTVGKRTLRAFLEENKALWTK